MADKLEDLARSMLGRSYSPYSGFSVGAAVRGGSGRSYGGANVENAAYGSTICAERVAVLKAVTEGETHIERVVIVTDSEDPVPPCGACLQVLIEFCEDTTGITSIGRRAQESWTLAELIPKRFGRRGWKPGDD